MDTISLKKGLYALCEVSNICCDTGKKWESYPRLVRFETTEGREEFIEEWMQDNYDAESLPRVLRFEV